jgi:iron complex transport system substrate-binding protein
MGILRLLAAFCVAALLAAAPGGRRAARVVSQTVGTDELLLAIADPAQVAALSHIATDPRFSAVAAQARRFPQLSGKDAEDVVRYRPDLVLVSSYTRPELVAQLRKAGLRVLSFDRFNTLDDAYHNLRLLGREPGREAQAEALVAACRARVADLARRLAGVKPVRVLAPSSYGFLGGRNTTFQDLCDHAGAINVAGEEGLEGHAPTPAEKVLAWKVDKLVLSGEDGPWALERVRKLPPFMYMEAAKAGRFVLLSGRGISSVTHHRIDAYEQLARQLHPERFP